MSQSFSLLQSCLKTQHRRGDKNLSSKYNSKVKTLYRKRIRKTTTLHFGTTT